MDSILYREYSLCPQQLSHSIILSTYLQLLRKKLKRAMLINSPSKKFPPEIIF